MKARRLLRRAPFGLVALSALALASRSDGAPDDPADRGLDAYVEMPRSGVVGAKVAVDLRTFGFRSAVKPEPLGNVTVDAAWSDGDPTPVSIVTDDAGTGQLVLTIPDGATTTARLVVGLTFDGGHGVHRRTREFSLERTPRHVLDLRLPSSRVTPGTKLPVWIGVVDVTSGALAPSVPVHLALEEGGVVQRSLDLTTNEEGAITTVVDVPETDQPSIGWTLRASTGLVGASTQAYLEQFEYVPSRPNVRLRIEARRLAAGGKTVGRVRLRDAANEPIGAARVRYVLGTSDSLEATPPDWNKAAEVVTGEDGDATIPLEIPAVGFAKDRALRIQTEVDGRLLEASDAVAVLSKESPLVEVSAEDGALVPGIAQRVQLSVHDGWDKPVESEFHVVGDGLDATVRTDARGAGEVTWDVPVDVGASRDIGPCAGGVAATLTITASASAPRELLDQGAVPVCVPVDRARGARIELGSLVARAGEALPLRLLFAKPPKPLPGDPPRDPGLETAPFSVSVSSYDPGASLAWFTSPEGAITLPETGGGVFRVSATIPRSEGPALLAIAKVLVKPRVLPKLATRVTGGRLAPGGEVEIEAKLVDESGAPLQGSVTAILNDKFASEDDPDAGVPYGADTRLTLCHHAGIRAEDCDAALANDPAQAVNLRASLPSVDGVVEIANDPGASARKEMLATFRTMLMNLEGAVYQAAQDPARLRDVLRSAGAKNEFNPEVLTLVTNVLDAPPTTPGGAPFVLEDLVAIDPQVTYDNVARRVTRLKLFEMLQQVRRFRQARAMDAEEPVLGDPNGILRRLLAPGDIALSNGDTDGATISSALLDPWGGSMQFVKGTASGLPFFEPIPGYKLHAPGPDGKLGTADDVSDPFVRILKSGTPYANAMGEDRVVDSRLDMQVADATVDNWSTILTSFTGTQLSSSGAGFGNGSGRLSGSHRTKPPQVRMGATSVSGRDPIYELAPPVRTDADGIARLKLRLGADETTYRVLALATVDGAGRAAATTEVSTTLPLSVRVDGGSSWVVGDAVSLAVKVTNRTDAEIRATVRVAASGAAALDGKESGERVVDVAARRSVWVNVGVRGASEGQAVLVASVEGGGLTDRIEHHVDVRPAGKHVVLGRSRWVSGPIEIANFSADARTALEGAPTLVVDPDLSDVVEGALGSLGVDGLLNADGALDSLEGLERARRYAAADKPGIARRAEALRDRVLGRFLALHAVQFGGGTVVFSGLARRARAVFAAASKDQAAPRALEELDVAPSCPAESRRSLSEELREVEGEPIAPNGAVESCWEGLVANVQRSVGQSGGRVELARLILAYADRPHRKSAVAELADKLAGWVSLDASGAITLPTHLAGDRAARAIVYAGLVRATTVGWTSPVAADTLLGWLTVQRAADGGFGSRLATRAAILALTAAIPAPRKRTLTITSLDEGGGAIGDARTVEITRGQRIPLDEKARAVRIDVDKTDDGVLVRLEQPALLGWTTTLPADELAAPLSLETRWPTAMTVGATATLEVRLSGTPDEVTPMLVRVPMPPGAYLAEPLTGVRMLEGAILVTTTIEPANASLPLRIPVRFGLAGSFTLGEAWAKGSRDDGAHARTPRVLVAVQAR